MNEGYLWTPKCTEIIEHRINKANGHTMKRYDQQNMVFKITTGFNHSLRKRRHKQVVDLLNRQCSCGKFQ